MIPRPFLAAHIIGLILHVCFLEHKVVTLIFLLICFMNIGDIKTAFNSTQNAVLWWCRVTFIIIGAVITFVSTSFKWSPLLTFSFVFFSWNCVDLLLYTLPQFIVTNWRSLSKRKQISLFILALGFSFLCICVDTQFLKYNYNIRNLYITFSPPAVHPQQQQQQQGPQALLSLDTPWTVSMFVQIDRQTKPFVDLWSVCYSRKASKLFSETVDAQFAVSLDPHSITISLIEVEGGVRTATWERRTHSVKFRPDWWHHLVVINGPNLNESEQQMPTTTVITVLVDGAPVGSFPLLLPSRRFIGSQNQFIIGNRFVQSGADRHRFQGFFDEIQIFNVSLSTSEVTKQFFSQQQSKESTPTLQWSFDENTAGGFHVVADNAEFLNLNNNGKIYFHPKTHLTKSGRFGSALYVSGGRPYFPFDYVHQFFEPLGEVERTLPWLGICFVISSVLSLPKAQETVKSMVKGLVFAGFFSGFLKFSTHRYRPLIDYSAWVFDGPGFATKNAQHFSHLDLSFPSGHAATVFAMATVLVGSFRTIWPFFQRRQLLLSMLQACVLCVAFITSLSRLLDDTHWLSDTVLGMFIGIIIGKVVLLDGSRHSLDRMQKIE